MFIAMNRFKVRKGSEHDFEQVWLRGTPISMEWPGFIAFHLLKGPESDDHVLYSSHTLWASEAAFLDWTRSEAFRKAHAGAGGNKPLYFGHPEFEGFTVIQRSRREARFERRRQLTRATWTRLSEKVGARPSPQNSAEEIEFTEPSERLRLRQ